MTKQQALRIYLTAEDRTALERLAEREYRPIHDQAALLIRQALERAGLVQIRQPEQNNTVELVP